MPCSTPPLKRPLCPACHTSSNSLANSNLPAAQYQRQKIMQRTVRLPSSTYTLNLAGLAGYQRPSVTPQVVQQAGGLYRVPADVRWNQMSDRASPSDSRTRVADGGMYRTSSTQHTVTRDRPGAMGAATYGVDIKHNSYNRYLNKLKGRGPLRRGVIPPTYGAPIPFNPAFPVRGGKIVKTAVLDTCRPNCASAADDVAALRRSSDQQQRIWNTTYQYRVGELVLCANVMGTFVIENIHTGWFVLKDTSTQRLRLATYYELQPHVEKTCVETLSVLDALFASPNENARIAPTLAEAADNFYCSLQAEATSVV